MDGGSMGRYAKTAMHWLSEEASSLEQSAVIDSSTPPSGVSMVTIRISGMS
jgi:hypothetical protein